MTSTIDPATRRAILAGRPQPTMTFQQQVWALCRQIPRGRVCTYGDLARAMGHRGSRAVGQALHRNPLAPQVPCHRVVGHDGRLTGFAGGLKAKEKLLHQEGVTLGDGRVALDACRWQFPDAGHAITSHRETAHEGHP